VIYVSHKLDELYEICDRVTIMRDGRTVAVSAISGLSKLQMVATMLGRDLAEVRKQGATAFTDAAHTIGEEVVRVDGIAAGRRVVNASATVREGEIVGLAGLLGSGRSETARAIFGDYRPERGEIRWRGEPKNFRQPADAIATGIGFLSEDRKAEGIIPEMSVRENLTLAVMPALSRSGVGDEAKQQEIVARFIKRPRASSAPALSRKSASYPAATSRKCCCPAGCA
jgi:ribose transport system ATP-binding protein